MECTQCAMELSADANFCPRCGRPTEPAAPVGSVAIVSDGVSAGQSVPDRAMEVALAEALRASTLSGGVGAKVQTSPFPQLPETSASPETGSEKLSGQTIHALLAQANLHRMRRKWEEAIDCCVAVLRMQPANQTAHVLLGDVYRDQNRLDDAIQWYGMAVDLRPNPTDQAKLEQAVQERDRRERLNALRVRQGYGDSSASAIDQGTDLNTGTRNLMGLSPRRWLRGITVTSLAFVCLALLGLLWSARRGPATTVSKTPRTPAPFGIGSFDLPSYHLNKTLPPYKVAQAANGDRVVITGGTGLAPDRNLRTTTAPVTPRAPGALPPASHTGPTLPAFGSPASGAAGAAPQLNIPPAPVQDVRPLPSAPVSQNRVGAVASPAQPSNRLTDGLQHAQTVGDGGIGATVLLSGAPSLVLDNSPRSQEILVRNVYRAARTAFANNAVLMKVKVFIETQTPTAGQAVVVEAELDRSTANNANPDTDDAASLQNRLAYFRYVGNVSAPLATPDGVEAGAK